MIFGKGSPVAMQIKAAIPPAFTFWLIGASLITGGSATNKKEQTLILGIEKSQFPRFFERDKPMNTMFLLDFCSFKRYI